MVSHLSEGQWHVSLVIQNERRIPRPGLVQQVPPSCCDWDEWNLSGPLFWDTLPLRTTVCCRIWRLSNKAQLPSDLGEDRIVGCGNGSVCLY